MLITAADVLGVGRADVRIAGGRVAAIGRLERPPGEQTLDASGGALLPGLNDHHLHLLSYAAARASIPCGPPRVRDAAGLARVLAESRADSGAEPRTRRDGWLRGYGYHESVAGEIDRRWLDRHVPDRPLRVQHRSGRLWVLNSAGLELLETEVGAVGAPDGRLYDGDHLLRRLPSAALPGIRGASAALAARGVTGFTDMTPGNGADTWALFADMQRERSLLQRVRVAGKLALDRAELGRADALQLGATKVHLHESALPGFAELCALIGSSHERGRPVAIHCVTEAELVFALAALRDAATRPGDRIEHASVTPPALLEQLQAQRLTVVTQPNFVAERGDAYLADLPPREHPWLYRCASFLAAGIPLAAGTDAPFGEADPWRAMRAAVDRRTLDGAVLGAPEALTPERALDLFLGPLDDPARPARVTVGAAADLCLLDRPWSAARERLAGEDVRATIRGGELIYDRVDQAPG